MEGGCNQVGCKSSLYASSEAAVLEDLAWALVEDCCSATAWDASAAGATGVMATAITTGSTIGPAGTRLKGEQSDVPLGRAGPSKNGLDSSSRPGLCPQLRSG